jgi:hypothetical protein
MQVTLEALAIIQKEKVKETAIDSVRSSPATALQFVNHQHWR